MNKTPAAVLTVVVLLLLAGCSNAVSERQLRIDKASESRQFKIDNLIAQGCNEFNKGKDLASRHKVLNSFGSLARLDPRYAYIAAAAFDNFLNFDSKNLPPYAVVPRYSDFLLLSGFCSTDVPIPLAK